DIFAFLLQVAKQEKSASTPDFRNVRIIKRAYSFNRAEPVGMRVKQRGLAAGMVQNQVEKDLHAPAVNFAHKPSICVLPTVCRLNFVEIRHRISVIPVAFSYGA